ncbi:MULTISPECIES: double-strand break repair protein AddB [unclassified Saccharibacter]|uniref:double-strand break repair protein AddB n=1 Tax=unclassified Saccharibacter TaxID=2648722 RepID=UPI001324BBB2|nr:MULTISPECIES: double-strand break repair protein AddB [unclassified Saccharibacter]MXV36627.1 double-strand break repair protein AddB [Saccharibacter sp. EH611]MXV58813.1 double-strand break repair protein AddB [Saccharibacter sp. EH70]MXV65575.1 double-strand break repair protein AddB [Saccharibacter sp. EH60]
MSIATIPASLPFLDHVALNWLERIGLQGEKEGTESGTVGTILVPGRRAARSLMEAFLRVLDGRAALLPSIVALGDVDGEALFSMRLEEGLAPAVEPTRRLAILAQLIVKAPLFHMGAGQEDGGTIERVWPLAQALAELMDEAERCGISLSERLPHAVAEDFADHWQKTLLFLQIVTDFWPQWLAEEGLSNLIARQVALLAAQAKAWQENPPEHPVWAVGFVDGSAGVATVLEAVAALPRGVVVLQGVDCALPENLWESLTETHPQALFREFLAHVGVRRAEIEQWGVPKRPGREALMRTVLLPEQGISRWGERTGEEDCAGLSLLTADDSQQEAQTIALILRDVASQPGKSAALVTPDRALAQRVRSELVRFGIHADDSAGEPLVRTPGAVFLRLIAACVSAELSPVALLSVLKHPLAALGMTPGQCRILARLLERAVLRGPAPAPGIAGLRAAVQHYGALQDKMSSEEDASPAVALMAFLDRLESALTPLLSLDGKVAVPDLLEALITSAQTLASVEGEGSSEEADPPGVRLWQGDDGAMLSQHLVELLTYTKDLPPQPVRALEGFLTVSMAGKSLTGLRGHQGGVELAHPRISIYGVLEARLLAFDTVILGGLNETVWPPAPDSGPWMSRPMRQRVGLFSPERQIGASAHDFAMAALAADNVILSRSQRREGGPAVPARWLVRLLAFLAGRGDGVVLPDHPALFWQEQLDQPAGDACPVSPPEPCPPLALRPRRLSITAIDTLKTDPYAIYARYVLRLKALSPLEEGVEHADYGMIVHSALERMFRRYPKAWPQKAAPILRSLCDEVLEEVAIRPALQAWWRPRLARIADWVAQQEEGRCQGEVSVTSHTEVTTQYRFPDLPGGSFTVAGRADRIDLEPGDGGEEMTARVYDYKTGSPPTGTDVVLGWASQMVLEAALLGRGAFESLPPAQVTQLLYWKLSGGVTPGEVKEVPSSKSKVNLSELVEGALEQLRALLTDYDTPSRPYRSQPWAGHVPRYTDYAQLARVDEWRLSATEDDA